LDKIQKSSINTIRKKLENSVKILITTHSNPDGDAIGSALGLSLCLENAGYNVVTMTPNDYPEFLQWLPGNDKVVRYTSNTRKAKEIIDSCDLIFALDFNQPDRLAKMEKPVTASSAFKILIDHHPYPYDFTDVTISDISVSSTAEKVYQFIVESGLKKFINKSVAECLFTGVMTDTGAFNFNSSGPETYAMVGELLSLKIDKDAVFDKVYNNYSADRMRLMGYCLESKMKVFPDLKTAYISITAEELKRFNYQPGDTEGFVNLPLSIKGIVFAVLFIEKSDHIKVSFRSKGTFAVNEIARQHFSGGGHLNAAGGEIKKDLNATLRLFEELLPRYIKNE